MMSEAHTSKENTYKLLKAAAGGDRDAVEQLVKENEGLVNMAARRFTGSGLEFEDLRQIGFIGLLKAIERFQPDYDVMLSTYAVPMIIGEIKRFLRDDGKIKMSRQIKQDVKRMKSLEEKFLQKHGRSPRIKDLAEMMECSNEAVVELLEAKNTLMGISSIEDEHFAYEGMCLASDETESKKAELIDLKSIICSLKDRERSVILLRYFADMTQQQTGKILGISQVQVSRIEKKVLNTMKKSLS